MFLIFLPLFYIHHTDINTASEAHVDSKHLKLCRRPTPALKFKSHGWLSEAVQHQLPIMLQTIYGNWGQSVWKPEWNDKWVNNSKILDMGFPFSTLYMFMRHSFMPYEPVSIMLIKDINKLAGLSVSPGTLAAFAMTLLKCSGKLLRVLSQWWESIPREAKWVMAHWDPMQLPFAPANRLWQVLKSQWQTVVAFCYSKRTPD